MSYPRARRAPKIGSSYDVTLSDAAASSVAILLSGVSDTIHMGTPLPAPLQGAPGCEVFAAPEVNEFMPTSASGAASKTSQFLTKLKDDIVNEAQADLNGSPAE